MNKHENLVSLNELAKHLGINKSTLAFYVSLGLLKPFSVVGRMQIFKREETLTKYNQIKTSQKIGLTLKEIKKQQPTSFDTPLDK